MKIKTQLTGRVKSIEPKKRGDRCLKCCLPVKAGEGVRLFGLVAHNDCSSNEGVRE